MRRFLASAAALVILASCTSGQVAQLPSTTVVPLSASKLQLAVGVATMVDATGAAVEGLNVVETFRNSAGSSATTTNTPTISGPAGAFGAPAVSAISGLTLTQQATIGTEIVNGNAAPASPFSAATSDVFGNLTGAFGYGLAPDNLSDPEASTELSGNGCQEFTSNDSVRYDDANVPVSAQAAGAICDNAFASPNLAATPFYGGPPLWPSPAGFGLPIGFMGYASGFSIFLPCADAACVRSKRATSGTYRLSVAVPNGSGTASAYTNVSASSKLPQATVAAALPVVTAPAIAVQADGTGTVSVNVPADPRIYESIVYVTVPDCGLGLIAPAGNEPTHYYSIITKTPGPQTLFLSNLGPPGANGSPTHTFCNAADAGALAAIDTTPPQFSFSAVVVSFDYPAFEASYPANRSMTPPIANAQTGTADLSISPTLTCTNYVLPQPESSTTCAP